LKCPLCGAEATKRMRQPAYFCLDYYDCPTKGCKHNNPDTPILDAPTRQGDRSTSELKKIAKADRDRRKRKEEGEEDDDL